MVVTQVLSWQKTQCLQSAKLFPEPDFCDLRAYNIAGLLSSSWRASMMSNDLDRQKVNKEAKESSFIT